MNPDQIKKESSDYKISSSDIEAAWEIVNENEYLKHDPVTNKVLETGGILLNGEEVDNLEDFLIFREATIKAKIVRDRSPKTYEQVMVLHSPSTGPWTQAEA